MRFKDFLKEAKHRQDISVEKARELIGDNCSDMNFTKPFWRGSMKANEECYIIQGDQGGRSSANTSNHYTVIMDEFLPAKGFPKRSASIILTNNHGEEYARGYSSSQGSNRGLYAIFPFNGVPIGVCDNEDIWHTRTEIGRSHAKTLEKWNNWFDSNDVPDYSFEDLVQGIKDGLEDEHSGLDSVFDSASTVERDLRQAFTPPMLPLKLATSATVPEDKDRELWIGGKCVAVRQDIWAQWTREIEK